MRKWISCLRFHSGSSMAAATAAAVLLAAFIQPAYTQESKLETNRPLITKILRSSREYCRKLENTALDFVCIEDISERIDNTKEINAFYYSGAWRLNKQPIEKHHYVYDYQFVRSGNRKIENRRLLEEDGVKKDVGNVRDTATRMFSFRNVFFSPVNLLAESRQIYYEYHIAGEDVINGEPAVILEAVPSRAAKQKIMGGKIWFKKDDFSILRIDWDSENLSNSWVIQKTAKRVKGDPVISQRVEFGYEKNGVRFPSRFSIEESYIKKKGKKYTKSRMLVIYKGYKFFTVKTEVKY
jgi:hypothetical protein